MKRPHHILVTILALACVSLPLIGQKSPDNEDLLTDGAYCTACGPIACFAALTALGVPASLEIMVDRCHWKVGQLTTLGEMQAALESFPDVVCLATRISPEDLMTHMVEQDCVAILPIRKYSGDVDHAVTAVAVRNGRFLIVDYPELRQAVSPMQLADVWDGEALLVSPRPEPPLARRIAWAVGPGAACALLLLCLLGRIHQRETSGNQASTIE